MLTPDWTSTTVEFAVVAKKSTETKQLLRYAGIGARQTPPNILRFMENLAFVLAPYAVLRSGGASGADTAFEWGSIQAYGRREIYLPWQGYQHRRDSVILEPSPEAFKIAEEYHPAWDRCNEVARCLHARNIHVVLGKHLDALVDLVICWTPQAKGGGGTGQALRLAKDVGIEVWDLADPLMLAIAAEAVRIQSDRPSS